MIITTILEGLYMKKALTTAGVALALGLFAGVATTAHAADGDTLDNNNSTAQFTVDPATDGATLQLKEVPSFVFKSVSQEKWVEGEVSTPSTSVSGNLTITDYRSTGAGWTLGTKVGAFNHEGNDNNISATYFKFVAAKDVTGDDFTQTIAEGTDLLDNAGLLNATGADGMTGAGSTSSDFTDVTANLTLPKNVSAKSGQYTSTIDWSLGASASEAPAFGQTSAATGTDTQA
jgi:hypothetical protein